MTTVFILGAGASKRAGGPLISDFIQIASNLYRSNDVTWAKSHFEQVFEARKKMQLAYAKSSIDLDNIENLFSSFEMASLIGELHGLDPELVSELPSNLRYLILRTIEKSIKFPVIQDFQYVQPPYPYNAFAELIIELSKQEVNSPVSVINFNYDLCLDYALAIHDADFGYGLEESESENLNHCKVHGSLNWFWNDETRGFDTKPVEKFPSERLINRVGKSKVEPTAIDIYELINGPSTWGERVNPDPFIIPPTWNKGAQHNKINNVWKSASRALANAENIYIIGYSLPESDYFFKSFYALSTISEAIIERFVVYDPAESDIVKDRFRSLLGPAITDRNAFLYKCMPFSEAVLDLADEYGFEIEIDSGSDQYNQ